MKETFTSVYITQKGTVLCVCKRLLEEKGFFLLIVCAFFYLQQALKGFF